jgi:hypothetical protein
MVPMRPSRKTGTKFIIELGDTMDKYVDKFIYFGRYIN